MFVALTCLFTGLAATAALYMLLTPHVHYAALGLVGVVLSTASLYLLQNAAFVAIAQVLLYGGGVVVVLLFSLGLWQPAAQPTPASPSSWRMHLLAAGILTGSIGYGAQHILQALPATTPTPDATTHPVAQLGNLLLGPYVWAFEWTGLVLLLALVGAVYTIGSQHLS